MEWFQWKLNVQLLDKGASQLNAANKVGNKVKILLIKLLTTHGKDNINVFSETNRCLEVENFPKTAQEAKDLLAYETLKGSHKNVSMILHVTGLIPSDTFKNKIFNWLQMNNIFLDMTIFCNTKEMVTRIGYLTMIHPKRIYQAVCQ
eukprot:12581179-Ditylum_brightwellii.AAC.1